MVAIPGLPGRKPREITLRNLASIIHARMEEIAHLVNYQIENSGYREVLIGGVVVTGGGSQLKHITQLFEYVTAMDARIGYPTEHLANTNTEDIKSPMYATGIGLVLKGFEAQERKGVPAETEVASTGNVVTNKGAKRGGFFEEMLKKSKNWFVEDDE